MPMADDGFIKLQYLNIPPHQLDDQDMLEVQELMNHVIQNHPPLHQEVDNLDLNMPQQVSDITVTFSSNSEHSSECSVQGQDA